ncbi:MAG: hypothetical protein D6744_02710, partial [Planctomycetota bacterium]
PTSFGRVRKDLPALDPRAIRSFGFLISDKQTGSFALEVDWIRAVVHTAELDFPSSVGLQPSRVSECWHGIAAAVPARAPLRSSPPSIAWPFAAVREMKETDGPHERPCKLCRALPLLRSPTPAATQHFARKLYESSRTAERVRAARSLTPDHAQ